MGTASIAREIASLPPEAQKQILDFMAFLKTRYLVVPSTVSAKQPKLDEEPFIGMWQTRQDMQDSSSWVRNLRKCEWERA